MPADNVNGFNSPAAKEALAQAAEDTRQDDALSLDDLHPVEPTILPNYTGGRSVRADQARRRRLKFFGYRSK